MNLFFLILILQIHLVKGHCSNPSAMIYPLDKFGIYTNLLLYTFLMTIRISLSVRNIFKMRK